MRRIGSGCCARAAIGNAAAPNADHARPELSHQEIARVAVDVEDHLMPAAMARDLDRPDAVLAHVRQVHRLELVLG
jgi:hypothetical protein